jgi:hypothetical protein
MWQGSFGVRKHLAVLGSDRRKSEWAVLLEAKCYIGLEQLKVRGFNTQVIAEEAVGRVRCGKYFGVSRDLAVLGSDDRSKGERVY